MAWSAERAPGGPRAAIGRRLGLAVIVAGTAAYAAWVVPVGTGTHVPGWLVPAVIAAGAVAVIVALASLVIRGPAMFAAALAVALVSGLAGPAVASAVLVGHDQGALDTPFERPATVRAVDAFTVTLTQAQRVTGLRLIDAADGDPDIAAAQTSAVAAVFIFATGKEVLPIGGFDGTIPEPTLGQLRADIKNQKFRLVIAFSTKDPRLAYIAQTCTPLSPVTYACAPVGASAPTAGSAAAAQPGNLGSPERSSPVPAARPVRGHPS
jgi:hypothetical protein